MRRRAVWLLGLFVAPFTPLACMLAFDVGPTPTDAGPDVVLDSGGDRTESGVDASPGGFDVPSRWSTRVVANLTATIGWGASFDPAGKYLYLPREQPDASPLFARYDVNEPFADAAVPTTELNGESSRYVGGAVFQGEMLFVPDVGSANAITFPSPAFGDSTTWSKTSLGGTKGAFRGIAVSPSCAFAAPRDTSTKLSSSCILQVGWTPHAVPGPSSNGATVGPDGYFYLAPVDGPTIVRGLASQIVVDGGLESFDPPPSDAGASLSTKYAGVVASKDAVYFIPAPGSDGVVLRFDTTGAFAKPSSWTRHAITGTSGFFGGVFDGRYLYLVPAADMTAYRYDTTEKSFDQGWESHEIAPKAPGTDTFHGGAFDGRYVYFVGAEGGVLARFDTLPDRPDGGAAGTPSPSFY